MQQLYFIRHGNANYMEDSLTYFGVKQARELSATLEKLLPENLDGILASSPSGRAMKTAQELIPMLERKTGKRIYIEREPALDQMRSMGSVETILQNGRENTFLPGKYQAEYGIFVAHDKIIVATCLALAEEHGIVIPDFLKTEGQIDQSLVSWAMKEFGHSREKAEEQVRKYGMKPLPEIPTIAEASAIHLNLGQKQIEYIVRESMGM